jgi:hypothetical protein
MVASANAENIPLRAGSIDYQDILLGDGPVHLEGRDFSFDGWAELSRLDAADCAFPCSPGETLSLYATASGNDLPGFAVWRGTEYPDVGSLVGPNQLSFELRGRMRLPRFGKATTKIRTVPVRFSGTFFHAEVPFAVAQETLTGAAVATVTLVKLVDPLGEDAWIVTHLSYDIAKRK